MRGRIVCLVAGCLMVAALLLAACAPAATPTPTPTPTPIPTPTPTPTPEKEMVKVTLKKADGTTIEKEMEKPKYGGEFIIIPDRPVVDLDEAFLSPLHCITHPLTHQDLIEGDWTKGPTGTGEATYFNNPQIEAQFMSGSIAESWELTDSETITYRIRKGVHFALNPKSEASRLVNGREVDANDVVFSVNRVFTVPTAYVKSAHPWGAPTVTAPDKWTVVVKCIPGYTSLVWHHVGTFIRIVPHEVIEKYGNMRMWENQVGTGPFMLVDLVPSSTVTYTRNPNYWQTNPMGPGKGDQLPYLDTVKQVIIADKSTKLAAMRTRRVDLTIDNTFEDKESVAKTNPESKWTKYINLGYPIAMKIKTKPFDDISVRRALQMAINLEAIHRDYYMGESVFLNHPIAPFPEHEGTFIPLEQLPQSVQGLFSYNPEKARQLLAEAGYPNGFETEIVVRPKDIDLLSIIKGDWANIGVDLKLDVKEEAVWMSIRASKGFKYMLHAQSALAVPFDMGWYVTGAVSNFSGVDDAFSNETYALVSKYWNEPAKRNEAYRKWLPYCLEQVWYINVPAPSFYYYYSPWIKNYSGEMFVGYGDKYSFAKYIWSDQELKKKVTGK